MPIQVKGRTRRQAESKVRRDAATAPLRNDVPAGPALARVILTYEDGVVISLEGPEAKRWMEALNQQIAIGSIHGFDFPEFPWKKLLSGPAKK